MAVKDINGNKVFYLTAQEEAEFAKKEEARKKLLEWQEKRKANGTGAIYTINYYGAKRAWSKEYETIYKYVTGMGCSILVDAFGGSGFLSLLASRTNLFKEIYLNDESYLTINYHYVMKNDASKRATSKYIEELFQLRYGKNHNRKRNLFEEFIYYLCHLSECKFNIISKRYRSFAFRNVEKKVGKNKDKISYWVPRWVPVKHANVENAVWFFLYQYYNFRGSGNYDRSKKYPPHYYIERLKDTHELYEKIKLSQMYYKKFINPYLSDPKALILLDPPYLTSLRVKKNSYVCEMNEREHRYLLKELTINNVIHAKIVLCGYQSAFYDGYFLRANKAGQNWHCVKILRLGRRKNNPVHEHIWVNFEIDDLVNQNPNLFQKIY